MSDDLSLLISKLVAMLKLTGPHRGFRHCEALVHEVLRAAVARGYPHGPLEVRYTIVQGKAQPDHVVLYWPDGNPASYDSSHVGPNGLGFLPDTLGLVCDVLGAWQRHLQEHLLADDHEDELRGWAPADTLRQDYGIRQCTLSQAAGDDKVKTRPAPAGMKSNGKRVRKLYWVQDAIDHCIPHHQKARMATR